MYDIDLIDNETILSVLQSRNLYFSWPFSGSMVTVGWLYMGPVKAQKIGLFDFQSAYERRKRENLRTQYIDLS